MKYQISHKSHYIVIFVAAFSAFMGVKWAEVSYLQELDRGTQGVLDEGFARFKYAQVEVDFGNGSKRFFKGRVGSYTYALSEVLDSIAENGDLSLRVRNGDIAELAGFAGEDKWRVYLGGVEKKEPVENLTVRAGDRFVLRYE